MLCVVLGVVFACVSAGMIAGASAVSVPYLHTLTCLVSTSVLGGTMHAPFCSTHHSITNHIREHSQDEIENSNFDYRKKTETTNPDGERKVTGVVTYGANNEDAGGDEESPSGGQNRSGSAGDEEAVPNTFSNSWRLNVILAIVSCWFAMSLTGWGAIKSGGTAANPQVGDVSMWMIIVSQWLVLLMYLWTLIAPRVFPDRDFS